MAHRFLQEVGLSPTCSLIHDFGADFFNDKNTITADPNDTWAGARNVDDSDLGAARWARLRAPLAATVLGGVISSTLLTLVLIPVVYTFFDGLPRPVTWLLRRLGLRGTPQPVAVTSSLPGTPRSKKRQCQTPSFCTGGVSLPCRNPVRGQCGWRQGS